MPVYIEKMKILWPGFSPYLILVSPIIYIKGPSYIPVGSRMFTSGRATWGELSVSEVLAHQRGGKETHKCLDRIGLVSTRHHRDAPTEFLLVLGVGKETAKSMARAENQRA